MKDKTLRNHQKLIRIISEEVGGQEKLAKLIGVTQPAVSLWSKNLVPLNRVVKLCKVLKNSGSKHIIYPHDFYPDFFEGS